MTDHQKLALFFALILFIGFPYLGQLAKRGAADSAGGAVQTKDAKPKPPPVKLEPPLLTEANLINTQWEINISGIKARVTLLAEGKAAAETDSKMIGNIQGTWKVNGADLIVTASAMGQTKTVTLKISGSNILVEGKPVRKLM
ncbi:MAG: hypothetical protein NTU83_11235 [Candidatus Hydrogenedentes bacterium]|nr:hypothetical protein [Candidatus Hydrogenedentota bacterium]